MLKLPSLANESRCSSMVSCLRGYLLFKTEQFYGNLATLARQESSLLLPFQYKVGCTVAYLQAYKAGEWYRLTVELKFKRRYGFYILQVPVFKFSTTI